MYIMPMPQYVHKTNQNVMSGDSASLINYFSLSSIPYYNSFINMQLSEKDEI